MKKLSSFVLIFAICVSANAVLKDPKLAIYYSFDDVSGREGGVSLRATRGPVHPQDPSLRRVSDRWE